MKKVIILSLFVILVGISFISAECNESQKRDDWCFGTKIYSESCNGTDFQEYVKGDCSITDMICRNAECIEKGDCKTNIDCDDENSCTDDLCLMGESKQRCEYLLKSGCNVNDICIPTNTRITQEDVGKFCNINGNLDNQKESSETCDNNYECKSNSCFSGKCKGFSKTSLVVKSKFGIFWGILLLVLIILILFHLKKFKR